MNNTSIEWTEHTHSWAYGDDKGGTMTNTMHTTTDAVVKLVTDNPYQTLQEIAQQVGVTGEWVRQIIKNHNLVRYSIRHICQYCPKCIPGLPPHYARNPPHHHCVVCDQIIARAKLYCSDCRVETRRAYLRERWHTRYAKQRAPKRANIDKPQHTL